MQINADVLRRVLKILVRLVPKKSTLPILEHVFIEARDGAVTLTTTDLITQAQVTIPATEPFSVCLPVKALLEFTAAVSRTARLTFKLNGGAVVIASEDSSVELACLSATEFPAAIAHEGNVTQTVDGPALRDALNWTALAVSRDVMRPQLAGVLFDRDRIVATDGHRLHMATVEGLASPKALVAVGAVSILQRACSGAAEIAVSFDGLSAQFTADDWKVATRLITGHVFPPYEQVIPKTTSTTFIIAVDSKALMAGIRRVGTCRGRHAPPLKMSANGSIKLETRVDDVEKKAEIKVVDSTHTGPNDHVVGFNGRFLSDAIGTTADVVTLRFCASELDPIAMEGDGRVAVVMPCRL